MIGSSFKIKIILFIFIIQSIKIMKSKMIDSEFMLTKPRTLNTSLFECQTPSKSICSIRSVKHANEHLFGSSNDYDKLYNHLFDMIQIRKVFMSSLKYLKCVKRSS